MLQTFLSQTASWQVGLTVILSDFRGQMAFYKPWVWWWRLTPQFARREAALKAEIHWGGTVSPADTAIPPGSDDTETFSLKPRGFFRPSCDSILPLIVKSWSTDAGCDEEAVPFSQDFSCKNFHARQLLRCLAKSCQSIPYKTFCSINTRCHKNFKQILHGLCKSNGLEQGELKYQESAQTDEHWNMRRRPGSHWIGRDDSLHQRNGPTTFQVTTVQSGMLVRNVGSSCVYPESGPDQNPGCWPMGTYHRHRHVHKAAPAGNQNPENINIRVLFQNTKQFCMMHHHIIFVITDVCSLELFTKQSQS